MKNNQPFLERISNPALFTLVVFLFFFKIIIYHLMKYDILKIPLGGGSDANYYHAYAQGFTEVAANIWPIILRYLNDRNLYSRELVSYVFLFFNLFAIPFIIVRLSGLRFNKNQKYYLYVFLLLFIYPTLFFYTFDVYRDVFMVFSFLIGCLVVKRCLHSTGFLPFIFYFSISIVIGMVLLGLRPYLGYAFLLSLLLWKIRFTKKRLVFLGVLYFLALFVANYAGFLDVLTEYRSGFEEGDGGSTLGLSFSNPIMFIPNFILSFLGQMLGLYITSPLAIFIFLTETAPFLFMLIYVIKNIKLADSFIRFLIIFFVLYGSVWLIGNDNLGTAVRLRMYNYLVIYISFFYILRLKYLASKRF